MMEMVFVTIECCLLLNIDLCLLFYGFVFLCVSVFVHGSFFNFATDLR